MNDLRERITQIAQAPILLVGSDYDGTISRLVDDPRQAAPDPDALTALRNLSKLPQTHVAIISGRSLRDLSGLASFPDGVHLVGSHGGEFDLGFYESLPETQLKLRDYLRHRLLEIGAEDAGFFVEEKPGSLAFHYRNAPHEKSKRALEEIESSLVGRNGVHVRRGKMVIELGVVETSKGTAVEAIRHRTSATATIYFGDDQTDEEAFAQLTGPDVAVKVGEGPTSARFRVRDPQEAAQVLARLCEFREDWLNRAQFVPVEQHSMLSDLRTTALVAPGGRVVWFCPPRLDSNPLFAELLGGPVAGHFTVRPVDDPSPGRQTYRKDSFILETAWDGIKVTDFLDCSWDRTIQRAGRTDLVRLVEGSGEIEVEFAPRLDFGRLGTQLVPRDSGLMIEDTLDPIVLFSPGVKWDIVNEGDHQSAKARIKLDGPIVFELRYGTGSLQGKNTDVRDRLTDTEVYWSSWVQRLNLPRGSETTVGRSALVLKGLCHGPTGAIAAAATTSLPEHIGGVRNWDYRYCWLRDGAMAASALVKLGSFREALQFLDWVLGILDRENSPERFRPVYTVTGTDLPPEGDISELPGYRGSRPVRIGNAAAGQVQLDVFGPIVDLVALIMDREAPVSSEYWRLVEAMVTAVSIRWQQPDHGIWEVRTRRRHHVHSKTMCWVTVDRACRIAQHYLGRSVPAWEELRDRIGREVSERGWCEEKRSFIAAYDLEEIDAAVLEVGLSGLLKPDDPRFASTVEVIRETLALGPTVYRYRYDDGLPGFEGGFHLCTSWLIRSLALIGRKDEARELFDKMVSLAGPTGLLSEEYGARTERSLGNYPQAYSHLGLIEAALAVDLA